MGNAPQLRRFRTNPVELAIFSVVTLIFVNSVYNLFYDRQSFRPTALAPMAANPVSESRAPASTQQSFVNVEVRCDQNPEQDTAASKIRLTGAICGSAAAAQAPGADRSVASSPDADSTKLVTTLVVNTANKFNATVFTDINAGKFSTDYIPLNAGRNPIHLEFSYRGGKVVTQDFVIVKN